jgi:monoamine oxidase
MTARRLAVVGAGWAGLAAAVRGVLAGWQVTLFEMAPAAGGRARSLAADADCAHGTPRSRRKAFIATLSRHSLAVRSGRPGTQSRSFCRLMRQRRRPCACSRNTS